MVITEKFFGDIIKEISKSHRISNELREILKEFREILKEFGIRHSPVIPNFFASNSYKTDSKKSLGDEYTPILGKTKLSF